MQNRKKINKVRNYKNLCNSNGSSNDLSSYPVDSHYSQNFVYWGMPY